MAEAHENYKIVFTGPVASGKTTAINTISDIPTVSTEETATDQTQYVKESTTVAMDYGILNIPSGDVIHLYGTPGQERFSYMREILTEGGLGLVLLVNNNSPKAFSDLDHYIEAFQDFINKTCLVIGVTHMDMSTRPTLKEYHQHLARKQLNCPIFEIDARNKRDIQILLQVLLYSLR
ncbi:MAG: ATP/GTP-binding protein [Cocleimonas sp.]|nr:ATP/GTP-binding protein [Cocleimonas sp.]